MLQEVVQGTLCRQGILCRGRTALLQKRATEKDAAGGGAEEGKGRVGESTRLLRLGSDSRLEEMGQRAEPSLG